MLPNNFARLRPISRTDDSHSLEHIDDAGSSSIAELQVTLKHAGTTFSIGSHEFDRFIDDLRIFLEPTISSRISSHTSLPIPTISLDDRVIIDLLEHGGIDRSLDMIDDTLDLIRLDEDSLETIGSHSTRREIEHVTTSEEILSAYLVEDSTRVNI